ncbi:MAG: diguanylate cyclase [Proteobacteria bacterium]|nr:diguanylate cyclase [Pseudomonadota bacterium]
MDQTLQKTLMKYMLESKNDDSFIKKVNKLYTIAGVEVLLTVFRLLAGIDIPLEKCTMHWEKTQMHRQKLSELLGRNIDITTALCDYLQTATRFLNHPRLIESSQYENVIYESINDKLTGLFNRPYFDEAFNRQVALAKRYREDFSILFLDIDNFKEVNDTYGHLAGDAALREIAAIILKEKRDSDVAARFGGEEFVLLMTHTDNVSAFVFAERLRMQIAMLEISYLGQIIKVTISGGISSFPFNSDDPKQLLQMADNAVYLAKGAGKNTISHFKKEKRRYLRVKIHQPVLAQELDFNDSSTFTGISKDICIGGILFENNGPLPLGALIKVKIPVNEDTPLMLIGTVVRVEAFEDGRYDIGMTTSFKEMDKIANHEIAGILRLENMA